MTLLTPDRCVGIIGRMKPLLREAKYTDGVLLAMADIKEVLTVAEEPPWIVRHWKGVTAVVYFVVCGLIVYCAKTCCCNDTPRRDSIRRYSKPINDSTTSNSDTTQQVIVLSSYAGGTGGGDDGGGDGGGSDFGGGYSGGGGGGSW
jgi:uncharacterized membrane protein YgcG